MYPKPAHLFAITSIVAGLCLFIPTNHNYTAGPNVICGSTTFKCDKEHIQRIYFKVKNAVPGNTSDEQLESNKSYYVYWGGTAVGRIISNFSSETLTVENRTLWLHPLFKGGIARRAHQENGRWYSTTIGTGRNYYFGPASAYVNERIGPNLFNQMDRSASNQLRMTGPER